MSGFKRAVRSKVWLKVGLMGPSGSGKTYSALKLAKGLAEGGKIAAIDTENGSLSLYADMVEVDVLDIAHPFEPKKAIAAIKEATEAGYRVLIVDSMTHFWKWILEYKESLDRSGGSQYTNWGKAKPFFEQLKDALNQCPMHVICCMRAKDEYAIEKNDRGKDVPKKLGMGAIMEPGAEYEYTLVFDIGMDHNATASKDRTSLFDGEFHKISEATGGRLLEWLAGGAGEIQVLQANEVATPPEPPAFWVKAGGDLDSWHLLGDNDEQRKNLANEAAGVGCKTATQVLDYAQNGVAPTQPETK